MCGLNPFGQLYSVNGFLVTHWALHKSPLCFSLPTPFFLLHPHYTGPPLLDPSILPPASHHGLFFFLIPPSNSFVLIELLNYIEFAPCLLQEVLTLLPRERTKYSLAAFVLTTSYRKTYQVTLRPFSSLVYISICFWHHKVWY